MIYLQLGWSGLVKAGMTEIVEGDDAMVEYVGHTPSSPLRAKVAIESLVVRIDECLADWSEPGLGEPVQNLQLGVSMMSLGKYYLVSSRVGPVQLFH